MATKKQSSKSETSKTTKAPKTSKPKPLTKVALVDNLANKFPNLQKNQINEFLDYLPELVLDCLKNQTVFSLPHVGRFSFKVKPAQAEKKGRNPFTGAAITIKAKPATKKVRFKPAKDLADKVSALL